MDLQSTFLFPGDYMQTKLKSDSEVYRNPF